MNFFHGSGCPNAPVAVPTMPRYPFEKPPLMFGPNITGRFHGVDDIATGAFFFPNQERGSVRGGEDVWIYNVEIDASRVSSVYGNAETVQPQAVRFLACIKH